MWPRRKRKTGTGSGKLILAMDFSRSSWMRQGPHMTTQADSVNHWWWEMVSCWVFLTASEIKKLREKERSGERTNLANLHDWYQQRRKNGQRYYPDNDINPHLPVTSHPPAQSTKTAPKSNQPLNPDDYFTVKNRKISGAAKLPNSSLLLWTIVVIQTIMITCTAHYLP